MPLQVTLRRNGHRISSLTTRTRAPSGSFEIRRVIAQQLRADRITAVASRSGETCTAHAAAPRAAADTVADDNGHDAVDDHGHDSSGHS